MKISLVSVSSKIIAGPELPDGYKIDLAKHVLAMPIDQDIEREKTLRYCYKLYRILRKKEESLDLVIHFEWATSQVWLRLNGQLLNTLQEVCGKETTLCIEGEFNYPTSYNKSATNFNSGKMEIMFPSTLTNAHKKQKLNEAFCEDRHVRLSDNDINFSSFDTITVKILLHVEDEYVYQPVVGYYQLREICIDIQENAILKDVSIVAFNNANGCQEVFKANKCFLAAHSPVLKALLEGAYEESRTNKIKMQYSSACVQSLLNFMYTTDFPEAVKSSKLAVELFQAANYYQMITLEIKLTEMLLLRGNSWFDQDAACELFQFANQIELYRSPELKMKGVKVFYSKSDHEKSARFKKLIVEEWNTAMAFFALSKEK